MEPRRVKASLTTVPKPGVENKYMGFRDRGTAKVPDQVIVAHTQEYAQGCTALRCQPAYELFLCIPPLALRI